MDLTWLPWIAVAVLVLLKLRGLYRSPKRLEELAVLLHERDGLLVDVRSAVEYQHSHAPGAVNVPLGEEARHQDRLGPKSRPLLVHCASGSRSLAAVRRFKSLGFEQVHDLGTVGNARKL